VIATRTSGEVRRIGDETPGRSKSLSLRSRIPFPRQSDSPISEGARPRRRAETRERRQLTPRDRQPDESTQTGRVAALRTRRRRAADNWFAWWLEIAAVFIPAVIPIFIYFYETDSLAWSPAGAAIRHGDFLVPTLIISVDVTRRWWSEVRRGGLYVVVRWVVIGLGIPTIASSLITGTPYMR
jgi:hypothetical protein